jgi:GNAT superfamily N-acetyltransferase
MPAPAVVREATTADANPLATLLGELGYPSLPDSLPRRLERLQASGTIIALVAERDHRVLGLATAHILNALHTDDDVAWLTLLVVSGTARREGLGRRLVEAVERWVRSKGCRRMSVTSAVHRAGAHEFYDRLGYTHTGLRYSKWVDER